MVNADTGQEEAMSQFGSSPRFKQTLARWTLQQVVGVSYLGAGGSAGYLCCAPPLPDTGPVYTGAASLQSTITGNNTWAGRRISYGCHTFIHAISNK